MQLVEPRPARPIPIRITPLIDVVFILLVFFMLTSRLLPVSFMELSNSTGDTPLGAFTRVLSGLTDRGIDTHWKRANAQTP